MLDMYTNDMLSNNDKSWISQHFANKQEFNELKAEVKSIDKKLDDRFDSVMNSLDGISKTLDDMKYENIALKLSDDRQNRQIKHIAEEIDIDLPN